MESVAAGKRRQRPRWRSITTIALLALLFTPVIRNGDSVPLSSYPMYATPRSTTVAFIVPVGLDANQVVRTLSTQTIASTSDPLIAESFLRDQIRLGRGDALCAEIVSRLTDPRIVSVEIRSERHQVIDRVLGSPSLIEQATLATCPVP